MYCGPRVICESQKGPQPHYKKLHFYNAMTLLATTIAVRPQRVLYQRKKAGRLQIILLWLPFLLVIFTVISQSLTAICFNPFLTALEQETFSFSAFDLGWSDLPFSYLFLCSKDITENNRWQNVKMQWLSIPGCVEKE